MKFRLYGNSPQKKSISILVKDTNRRIMIVQLHYRSHIGFVKHRYLLTLFWQSPLCFYTGTTFCKPKLKEWARIEFNRKVEYSPPSRLLVTPIIPRQLLRELIVREEIRLLLFLITYLAAQKRTKFKCEEYSNHSSFDLYILVTAQRASVIDNTRMS